MFEGQGYFLGHSWSCAGLAKALHQYRPAGEGNMFSCAQNLQRRDCYIATSHYPHFPCSYFLCSCFSTTNTFLKAAVLVSGSVTTESTLSSSSMICPSKPSPIVRCLSFSVAHPDVRLTQEMSSTSTLVSLSVLPR